VRQVVSDPQSGYNFSISPDGKTIAYRRTLSSASTRGRVQEIVTRQLASGETTVLGSGENLSTPVYAGSQLLFTDNASTKNLQTTASARAIILGIEDTKIALAVNGVKRLLDPFRNGSYIWPALSPNAKSMVATEMARGAFVCTVQGTIRARLGKRNAAVWSRDGKWLIYMNDKDDGHSFVSHLMASGASSLHSRRV
jgi:Tol biopolymer transport system component